MCKKTKRASGRQNSVTWRHASQSDAAAITRGGMVCADIARKNNLSERYLPEALSATAKAIFIRII